jgi:hypothetical protein
MTRPPDEQPTTPEPTVEAAAAPAAAANADAAPAAGNETPDVGLAGEAMNLLSEHKGKLAIGVAATLGLMVYYGWREKRLAKSDPEEYARLQRIKAIVRHSDDQPKPRPARKPAATPQARHQAAPAAADAPDQPDATPDIS